MGIYEYMNYMVVASILFFITIGIIAYAIYKKDFTKKMHKLILGSLLVDVIGLILIIIRICQ